jgi:hypothetical protein
MRAIDFFLRALTLITAIGSLFLPHAIAWKLICGTFFAVGLWAVLFPPGALGWVRAARSKLEPSDKSIWWIPRFVGVAFIAFSLVFALAFSK